VFGGQEQRTLPSSRSVDESTFSWHTSYSYDDAVRDRNVVSAFSNEGSANGCRHSDLEVQELSQDGKTSESLARSLLALLPPHGASFLPTTEQMSSSPAKSLAKLSRTYKLSDVVLDHALLLEMLQSAVRSGHVVLVGAEDTGKDLKESCSCFREKQSELLVDVWVTVCNCCLVLLEIIIVRVRVPACISALTHHE
jgi:hypothetical protein